MSISNTFTPAPTGVTSQGSSVSNREDLTDVLTVLAPEETPVLSSASKQKANSTFVEWTVDTLADVTRLALLRLLKLKLRQSAN
jgi:hypothetical protein